MNKRLTAIFLALFALAAAWIFLVNKPVPKKEPILSQSAMKVSPVPESEVTGSFIENLRKRKYEGSPINIEETIYSNGSYTKYLFSNISDGLKIYGIMNVPKGKGPFPVVVLNHGYFNAASFRSGDGTNNMANILAANGYLTLASDYRGFGNSEDAPGAQSRGHRPDYAIDVLNLTASIINLPQANPDKIAMWGHSMGGEVSLRVVEATDKLKAVVLWAPTSANSAENAAFYGRRHTTTPVQRGTESDGVSPINYLDYIKTPISLHQGLSDTEVNPLWSKNLNDALKKAGKKVEYFEYEGQDHNFASLGWDEISRNTLKFFDSYLK